MRPRFTGSDRCTFTFVVDPKSRAHDAQPIVFREGAWAVAALREKTQQFSVHAVGMCPQDAVRAARQLDELDALDHFRLQP